MFAVIFDARLFPTFFLTPEIPEIRIHLEVCLHQEFYLLFKEMKMEFRGIETFLKAAILFTWFLLFQKGFELYMNDGDHLLLVRGKRQADNITPPPPPWDPSSVLGEASDLRPVNLNDTWSSGTTQFPFNTGVAEITQDPSLPRSGESSISRGPVSSETLLRQLLRSIGIGVALEPKQPRPIPRTIQSLRTSPRPQPPTGPKILDFDPLARLLDHGKSSIHSSVNGTEKSGNRTASRDSTANESTSMHMNENGTSQVSVNDRTGQTTKRESEVATSKSTSMKSTTTSGREKWSTEYHTSTQDVEDVLTTTTKHVQSSKESTSFSHVPSNSVFQTTADPSIGQDIKRFSLPADMSSTSTVSVKEIISSSFTDDIAADRYKSSTLQTTNESQGRTSSTQRTEFLLTETNFKTTTSNSIIQFKKQTPLENLAEDPRQSDNSAVEILQSVKPVITKFKGMPSELQGTHFAHFKLPMLERISGTNNMEKGGLNRNRLNGPVKS